MKKVASSVTRAAELGLLHLLHLVVLADNGTCLLGLELRDLDLALPVLVLAGLLDAVVALLDEVERLGHVLAILNQLFELALLFVDLVDRDLSLGDVGLLLEQARVLGSLLLPEGASLMLSLSQLLLQLREHLGSGARAELELDEAAVSLFDFLDVLLVGDLHLMEINELKVVAHLFLLLDLCLGLKDGDLERDVLLGELFNLGLFL